MKHRERRSRPGWAGRRSRASRQEIVKIGLGSCGLPPMPAMMALGVLQQAEEAADVDVREVWC